MDKAIVKEVRHFGFVHGGLFASRQRVLMTHLVMRSMVENTRFTSFAFDHNPFSQSDEHGAEKGTAQIVKD